MRYLLIAVQTLAAGAAHAVDTVPYACLPAQIAGTGTRAAVSVNGKCTWAGWYCPGERMPQLMVIRNDAITSTHRVLLAAALGGELDLAGINDIRSRLATGNVWSGPLHECWWPERAKLLAVRPAAPASVATQ